MIIELKKIKDLKFAPYNPRTSTEKQGKHLQESLSKFGFVEPIIFNKQTGHVVGGHFRIRELKKLGYKEIECVIVDLNEEDEKELNIRLNANSGSWDFDALANEWDANNLQEWGLDIPDFMKVELEAEEDDYEEPEQMQVDVVLGDLIEIGEHRLLCGDSTCSDTVARLMNGDKATCGLTDPPYDIDLDYSNLVLYTENAHIFIFNNDRALVRQLQDSPFILKKFFVFNHSGCAIPQEGGHECFLDHILISHEINGKPFIRFNKGEGLRTVIKGEYRRSENHKHEKPFNLLVSLLKGYTEKGSIVLDLFSGGGSLFSACEQTSRKCYGMEIDPKYCQVIIDRIIKLDSSLEVKINGKAYEGSEVPF